MGVSMLVQQKLNPAPPDPIQAKVMMALPFVFTFFFAYLRLHSKTQQVIGRIARHRPLDIRRTRSTVCIEISTKGIYIIMVEIKPIGQLREQERGLDKS